MPTYKNNTTAPITIEDVRLEAGETVKTNKFLDYPTGVSLESGLPTITRVIYSAKLTGTTTVTVPKTYTPNTDYPQSVKLQGNYKIRIYAGTSADGNVKLNNGTDVAKYLGANDVYEILCLDRIVDNFTLTVAAGTFYASIELV